MQFCRVEHNHLKNSKRVLNIFITYSLFSVEQTAYENSVFFLANLIPFLSY